MDMSLKKAPPGAAVEPDRLAGDVARLRRAEVGAEVPQLGGVPIAPHRQRLRIALELLLEADPGLLGGGGRDRAGAVGEDRLGPDAVYRDAKRRQVGGNQSVPRGSPRT